MKNKTHKRRGKQRSSARSQKLAFKASGKEKEKQSLTETSHSYHSLVHNRHYYITKLISFKKLLDWRPLHTMCGGFLFAFSFLFI